MSDELLKVYYPLGGHRYLLQWWTQHDRGHVVLAPTAVGLCQVAERVFDEEPFAEIKAFLEIEIVAPSRRINILAAKHDHEERVGLFHMEIVCHLRDAVEAGKMLPSPFVLCTEWDPDESVDVDDWARERHYGCQNCRDTIRLVGMTTSAFYDRYQGAWYKKNPKKEFVDPKRMPSRAHPADSDEPLWYAHADFGHHAGGVSLSEVDPEEYASSYRPTFLSERVMFFFKKLRDLDPWSLQEVLSKKKVAIVKEREFEEKERIAKRKSEEREKIAEVIAFFKERSP